MENVKVGVRTKGDTVELVRLTDEEFQALFREIGGPRSTWHATNLGEEGVVYLWLEVDPVAQLPLWLDTPSRETLEATRCELGHFRASLVVSHDSVILVRGSNEDLLTPGPPGSSTGHVSMFG